jgi:hypothetical protein
VAVARVVTHYMLTPTRVYGFGKWTGLGTPDTIGFVWQKQAGALTGGEQTSLASILSFVGTYIATDETPTGRVLQQNAPCITTNAAGDTPVGVDNKGGVSNAAVDKTLGMWTGDPGWVTIQVHAGSSPTYRFIGRSQWVKALAAFTGGEQTTLTSFTAALAAYLAADLPLPPWT